MPQKDFMILYNFLMKRNTNNNGNGKKPVRLPHQGGEEEELGDGEAKGWHFDLLLLMYVRSVCMCIYSIACT